MKQIIFIVLVIASIGCETEPILFEGPYHVRFTENSLLEKESYSPVIEVAIHLAGPAQEEDVQVNYSISGNAREGIDYQIIGTRGQTFIEEGELFGTVRIKLLNNANNILRSQDLVLRLTSASSGLRVGQSKGGIGREFKLTIVDDCILGGTYSGVRNGLNTPTTGLRISSTDCENYVLNDWDVSIFDDPFPVPLTFRDNGDNTITIPNQNNESYGITFEGIGTVNPLTDEIFMVITITTEDNDQFEFRITLTRE
jgi:hypothetical protein